MNTTITPCTPKQAGFLAQLVAARAVPPAIVTASNQAALGMLTAAEASRAIEAGLKAPYAAKREPAALGYYLVGQDVFALVEGKDSGKPYAKKLVVAGKKGAWVYAPGAVYTLLPGQLITLPEAVALGHTLGCCVICGRTLSDARSVAAGIGPVCAKKVI